MDSFHLAVARQSRSQLKEASEEDGAYYNFSDKHYSFRTLQASEFLTCRDGKFPCSESAVIGKPLSKEQKAQLKGGTVLIGGNFGAARDEYMTPWGSMEGVELIANAIESESGSPVRDTRDWKSWGLDFTLGSLIVFIYFACRENLLAALVLSLASIAILPPVISFLAFKVSRPG